MKPYTSRMLVLSLTVLAGCASKHNLDEEGHNIFGGGFSTEEIAPGFYKLYAASNSTLITTMGAAQRTWDYRASQLCGEDSYTEFAVKKGIHSGPEITVYIPDAGLTSARYQNSSKEGFLLCNFSGLDEEQAKNILKERLELEQRQSEERSRRRLAIYDPKLCKDQSETEPAEYLFSMGKAFYEERQFGVAMSCFIKVQRMLPQTAVFQESAYHIATMYELGQGVESNPALAKEWYEKAGYKYEQQKR